ncbi:MAG TPA: helix-turn-helix domain-containing protein [Roseiflexaceae bacterium]|nr:helix-turn-helix domain-containing protein [Roseiflexaceae bacterium]
MRKIPLGPRAVYATLCGLLPVGERRRVSQELIAEETGVSEATVSRAMPVLVELGLVEREAAEDGRGYDLTLLPLPAPPEPDERLAAAVENLRALREARGSATDPESDADTADDELEAEQPNRTRQTAPAEARGSVADPASCMDDHDSESIDLQQQHGHGRVRDSFEQIGVPVVSEAAWAKMLRGTPGYTTAHYAADYKALIERGKTPFQALGLITWARSEGGPIWTTDDLEQRARRYHTRIYPDGDPAPTQRPARPERGRNRHQREEIPRAVPLDLDAQEEREARLARLLPPDWTEDDELELCIAFDAGLDDAGAVAAMEEARRART